MIGTRKVSSIDVGHPDVVDAVDALDDWTETLLKRGWWFNKMSQVTYSPDVNGFINFASNVIRFEYYDTADKDAYPLLSKRGNRLLNVETNTFVFQTSIELNVYITLDWEDLPQAAQHYLVYRAGADLVRDKIEDTVKVNDLKRDAQEQMDELHAEEIRTEAANMFENPAVQRVRQGRRPMFNRTIGGFRNRLPTVD